MRGQLFQKLTLPVGHGQLEALLQPVPEPRGLALVCHPHPLFGGTMQNTVTHRLSRAWNTAGFTSLRFNFRGVGASTGQSGPGDGAAELEDAQAALDWLTAHHPALPCFTSGFSFGSRTALQLAGRARGVVAVGYPVSLFPGDYLRGVTTRAAFVHGDQDEYATLAEVRAMLPGLPARTALFPVERCDHFATGRLDALSAVLSEAIAFVQRAE